MNFLEDFLNKHHGRVIGLDILRSLAILLVMYSHGIFLIPKEYHSTYQKIGFIKIDGVSLFFVLSGFLIGGILLKIIYTSNFTKKNLLDFWIRRWFRTIPNYFLVLGGLLLYKIIVLKVYYDFDIRYFIFSQNLFTPHPFFFAELWSLAVEEWFYLLFPFSCFLLYKLLKNKERAIVISIIFFLLFPLVLRIVKYELGIGLDDIDREYRKIVFLRLDSLMYGIIGAYIYFRKPESWLKYRFFFLGLGIILLIVHCVNPMHWRNFYSPISSNIESIITLCFLPSLSCLKSTKSKLLDGFFLFISLISYSMYLINLAPVQIHFLSIVNKILDRKKLPIEQVYVSNYIMFWVFTILFSYLLYRFYENPMTKLRDKITSK